MNKNTLKNYYSILAGESKAKYLSEDIPYKRGAAEEILHSCRFCERRCGVDRLKNERGYCGVIEPRICSEFLHWGEEPPLVPSYTIFFAGCTFRCVFCQNWDISQNPEAGAYIKPTTLAKMITQTKGINVNWVGGDPTPNIHYILQVLERLERNIPQIWNSNMYMTEEALDILDGVIDVYLTDFKYGNNDCAKRLSDARNYVEIIERNHLIAEQQTEVIIRHLVMPDHLDCCTKPILDWIAENMSNPAVNIMGQYHPEYLAGRYLELKRRLSPEEYNEALEYGRDLGLELIL